MAVEVDVKSLPVAKVDVRSLSADEVDVEFLLAVEVDVKSLPVAEVESLSAVEVEVEFVARFVEADDVLQGGRHRSHVAGPEPGTSICPLTSVSEQKGPEASEPGAIAGNWQR